MQLVSFFVPERCFYCTRDLIFFGQEAKEEQTPGRYEMTRAGETVTIEVTEENGERAIGYDGKFFRSFEDFCSKAEHNGKRFTAAYDEFYNCRKA